MSATTRDPLVIAGVELPAPSPPAGAYQPCVLDRGVGWLSAQVPPRGHPCAVGRVGSELTEAQGREAARMAALVAIARIHEVLGGLDRLRRLLRVDGHVASADGFLAQPRVLDGASEAFVELLGERGRHARTAFAPARLPHDVSVELAITFAYDE